MKNTLITLKTRLLSPITILGWTVSSLVMAVMGPFNTYEVQSFTGRLLFWAGVILLSTGLAIFCQVSVRKSFPKWPLIPMIVLACGVFILIDWPLVILIVNIVYGHLELPPYGLILLIISGVGASIFSIVYLVSPDTLLNDSLPSNLKIQDKPREPAEPSAQTVPSPEPAILDEPAPESNAFLAQIGPIAGERLIRLAMRDHYIEVYTEVGQKLVHMRFGDAVSQLKDHNGGQVHRSHWISFDDIKDVVKDGDKLNFRMSDDALVPIARSRKPELKKRGLI